MSVMMLIVWLPLLLILLWGLGLLGRHSPDTSGSGGFTTEPDAGAGWTGIRMRRWQEAGRADQNSTEGLLRDRLASGEISEAEYRERAAVLQRTEPRRRGPGRSTDFNTAGIAVAATLGAVLIVLFALSVGAAFGGWQGMMPGHMRGFGWGGGGGTGASSPPLAGAPEVAVEAGDLWFRPATLEVPAGQQVNITATNSGRVFHDFTVDRFDFQLRLDPGDTVTGGVRVGTPGEYRFYCSVPGHASAGMRGTLVVVESS